MLITKITKKLAADFTYILERLNSYSQKHNQNRTGPGAKINGFLVFEDGFQCVYGFLECFIVLVLVSVIVRFPKPMQKYRVKLGLKYLQNNLIKLDFNQKLVFIN